MSFDPEKDVIVGDDGELLNPDPRKSKDPRNISYRWILVSILAVLVLGVMGGAIFLTSVQTNSEKALQTRVAAALTGTASRRPTMTFTPMNTFTPVNTSTPSPTLRPTRTLVVPTVFVTLAPLTPFAPITPGSVTELGSILHSTYIYSVVWSPDGTKFATGSYDHIIRVWDFATAQELLTIRGHTEAVYSVAWSPDGTRLASGGADGTIRIWDAATGENLRVIDQNDQQSIWNVQWSPDGLSLTSGSDNYHVRLWDAQTGTLLQTLESATREFQWSLDGRVFVGTDGATITVWQTDTWQSVFHLSASEWEFSESVYDVSLSYDGHYLAAITSNSRLQVWDIQTATEIVNTQAYRYSASVNVLNSISLEWSPVDMRLITFNSVFESRGDDYVDVWDGLNGTVLHRLPHHPRSTLGAATWSPDGNFIAVANDIFLKLWAAPTAN